MAALLAGNIVSSGSNKMHQPDRKHENPHFDTIATTRSELHITAWGAKMPPPGLTRMEEKLLQKVQKRAYRLNMCLFSFCGICFGWSSVIALIPAVGDVADMVLAVLVVRTCCQAGLSPRTKAHMFMNIFIDFLVGLLPLLGDIADATYKCNTKNASLLERELQLRGKKRSSQLNRKLPAEPSPAGGPDGDPTQHFRPSNRIPLESLAGGAGRDDPEAGWSVLRPLPPVKVKSRMDSSVRGVASKRNHDSCHDVVLGQFSRG